MLVTTTVCGRFSLCLRWRSGACNKKWIFTDRMFTLKVPTASWNVCFIFISQQDINVAGKLVSNHFFPQCSESYTELSSSFWSFEKVF